MYNKLDWKNGRVRYDLFAACAWHTYLIFRYAMLVKRFRGSAFLPCRAVKSVQRLPTFQGLGYENKYALFFMLQVEISNFLS